MEGSVGLTVAATVEASVVVLCYFPRTDAITLEDKDVEFITKLGPMEIKKKFKLEDMVFGGHLAL